ncbi:MAG: sugar phosphate isomerase/epimerase [Gammaproteobacteria bacterium]|nr:sugar phosphate isomerase/epimerase [Gammaproteobacteria bacterium]
MKPGFDEDRPAIAQTSRNIQFSLAHLSALDLTPPELVIAAAEANYDYVGLRFIGVTAGGAAWPLWKDKATMAGTKARMAETGVGVLDVELLKLLPDTDVRSFEHCIQAAAEIGARHLLTQADDPEFSRLVDNYSRLCDLAAPYGLSCDVEFIPWIQTANLKSAGALVKASGRDNVGILIDSLHFARAGCRLEELDEWPAAWFHYIQLCDAPAKGPATVGGLIYAAREERLLPGDGELDLMGIMRHLPYPIVIGIEMPAETLSFTASPGERAAMARESALRLFQRNGYPAADGGD